MTWNKYDVALENYLEIGTHLVEKNGLYFQSDSKIWDELFLKILIIYFMATKKGSNHTFNNNLYKFVILEYKKVHI